MSIAPLVAAERRWVLSRTVQMGTTPPLGVAFQVQTLGRLWPNARLIVEAAFGADITTDSAGWNWYDITGDVRFASGVTITRGRGDEASQAQPSSATISLDNTTGNYTAWSSSSVYWPNIGLNTPLRVRVDLTGDGSIVSVRMFGYALGWVPTWDVSGNLPTVTVTFKGVLQRLQQGKSKARSAIRRFYDVWPLTPIAYWPLEDPSTALAPSSALPGGQPMQVVLGASSNAYPKFAAAQTRTQPASTGFEILQIATDPIVSLGDGGGLFGAIPAQTGTPIFNVVFMGFVWATDYGSDVTLVRLDTPGGRFTRFEVIVRASGSAPALYGWTNDPTPVKTLIVSSALAFPDVVNYRLRFVDNGDGTFAAGMRVTRATTASEFGTNTNTTVTGQLAWPTTIYGNPYNVIVNKTPVTGSTNQTNDIIIGHLGVYHSSAALGAPTLPFSGTYADGNLRSAWGGWVGEPADDRLRRLCAEDGIPIDVTGVSTTRMGIQSSGTIINLLREVETTDFGVLYDGYTRGLSYACGPSRYNVGASLTADMALDPPQLDDPFEPADNDQRRRNSWKVTRTAGGEASATQDAGILGINAIGEYDDSKSVNTWDTTMLQDMAAWLVHLGVTEGFRYPQLNLDLVANPELAVAWIMMAILGRIDVLNVTTRAPQHPPGTVSQILEGYTETLNPIDTWSVAANASPYAPYRVGITDTTGFLDCGASTVAAPGIDTVSTALLVQITDLCTWVHTDGDFGILVGGEQMTVTAVSAVSGAYPLQFQTLTVTRRVNGFLRAHAAGEPVNVTDPFVLSLG